MSVIRASRLQPITGQGSIYWPLATPSTGATELIVARVAKAPGHPGSIHSHDHEEVVVALAGMATAVIDGQEIGLATGDVLLISASQLHQVSATGDESFECLIAKPAGTRFYDSDGQVMSTPTWMA
jgi:quercetin dioxygenase-like cupin family protein